MINNKPVAPKPAVAQVMREILALGYPLPYLPRLVTPGPFIFTGSIADNATTPIDLTLAAAMADDANLVNLLGAGSDNPPIMVLVTGVRFYVEGYQEASAPANLDLVAQRCALYWSHGRDIRMYRNLRHDFVDANKFITVVDSDQTAETVKATKNGEDYMPLPGPWLVNLATDTFQIAPQQAINTNAAVSVGLIAYGCAWAAGGIATEDFVDVCGSRGNTGLITQSQLVAAQLGRR